MNELRGKPATHMHRACRQLCSIPSIVSKWLHTDQFWYLPRFAGCSMTPSLSAGAASALLTFSNFLGLPGLRLIAAAADARAAMTAALAACCCCCCLTASAALRGMKNFSMANEGADVCACCAASTMRCLISNFYVILFFTKPFVKPALAQSLGCG
jgi:hypothetical protein